MIGYLITIVMTHKTRVGAYYPLPTLYHSLGGTRQHEKWECKLSKVTKNQPLSKFMASLLIHL